MQDIINIMHPFWEERDTVLLLGDLYPRDVPGNDEAIDGTCSNLEALLKMNNIPTQQDMNVDDKNCVDVFKYLVLNTDFSSENILPAEDPCDELEAQRFSMHPYLLIEILFFLWYEDIIAESVLHLPLNVTVELIDVSKNFLHELEFDRRSNFLSILLSNIYKRLNLIIREGALAFDMDDESKELMNLFDELMNFFSNDRIVELSKVRGLERSERIGFIIQKMLYVTIECFKCEESGIDPTTKMRNLYRLSCGNKFRKKAKKPFRDQLRAWKQTFVENFWQQVFSIFNEDIYNDWAQLVDPYCLMNLQHCLRVYCYQLMNLIEKNKNIKTEKLMQILEVIKPLEPSDNEILNSKRELDKIICSLMICTVGPLTELSKRYREWDSQTFHTVCKFIRYMEDEDFANFLEYYIYIMGKSYQEDYKRRVYTVLSNVLCKDNRKSGCGTVLISIFMHSIKNTSLESLIMKENTETLPKEDAPTTSEILPKIDLKSPLNLRIVLISMLEVPIQFLTILVKICIGHSHYKNLRATISPNDLMFLSPIMTARLEPSKKVLLVTLIAITTTKGEWDPKKWNDFVQFMLENNIFTEDEFVNIVMLSFLEEASVDACNQNTMLTMLKTLKNIFPECTRDTSYTCLLLALAHELIVSRESPVSRLWFNKIVNVVERICRDMRVKLSTSNDVVFRTTYLEIKLETLNPIDDYHFQAFICPNLEPHTEYNFVCRYYEQHCSKRLGRLQELLQRNGKEINKFLILEDYIRHFFANCVESEYILFVDSIVRDWRIWNYRNEYEAYDKIVYFTVEACAFHTELNPKSPWTDRFPCLLKNLVKSTIRITGTFGLEDKKEVYDSLLRHLRKLDEWIEDRGSASYYKDFLSEMNNRVTTEFAMENLKTVLALVDTFADKCMKHNFWFSSKRNSDRAERFKVAYEFIRTLMLPYHMQVDSSRLLETYHILYPENQNE